MKLNLKEDPKEWRKAVWFGALGFAGLSSILRWRRVLPTTAWALVLVLLCAAAASAWLRPAWFRGYYRASSRIGFRIGQGVGYALLTGAFFLLLTPLGLVLRLFGKDLLGLKRRAPGASYWNPSRPLTPLDRLY